MLHRLFHTKEGRIATIVFALISITIGGMAYKYYAEDKNYEEQTVMAEKHLKEGNYEQAIKFYLNALSMKNSDREKLSIGLAEAYIGLNDYDKALETLRSCYQKTSSLLVKEKIEDVTARKTHYEYMQIITRAEKYFSNGDYDKAISEYESAKLIKSKEVLSYQRIAEAYIQLGEYLLARDQVEQGIAITQSDQLNDILNTVDELLIKQQYDAMIEVAAEYVYQENYNDGIKKYKEAIDLLPKEEQAYINLAEIYLGQKEFTKAIALINKALEIVHSNTLADLLDKVTNLKELDEQINKMISDLYWNMNQLDVIAIEDTMNSDFFKEQIVINTPIYYNPTANQSVKKAKDMIIYDSENIYFGKVRNDEKDGNGVYFILTQSKEGQGHYYYEGEWRKGIPNGNGTLEEVTIQIDKNGSKHVSKVVTVGSFMNGNENGSMRKYFYLDGNETGNISYRAQNGKPLPMLDENGEQIVVEESKSYAIGMLYHEDVATGEYYIVEPNTYWNIDLSLIQ